MDYENRRRGLLQFVSPNFLDVPVLVIESPEILSSLREILPAAKIALMTAEPSPELKKICVECVVDLLVGDYARGELPSAPKIFEVIIAPNVLSADEDCYPILLTLNHLLKDSGALLTEFSGELWTKAEVVKILDDAIYKEIHFAPDDSSEKIWLVKACKCTAEVAALKDLFTHETRAELSRLLHRIEYDIDAEENFQRLMKLCNREGIFDEYLTDFIEQVVVHAAAKNFIRTRAVDFGRLLD